MKRIDRFLITVGLCFIALDPSFVQEKFVNLVGDDVLSSWALWNDLSVGKEI